MVGRGIFGNPWFFDSKRNGGETLGIQKGLSSVSSKEKIQALAEHVKLFDKCMTGHRNFATMKKHFKAYISGFDGAKEMRVELMNTNTPKETLTVLKGFLKNLK